MFCRRRTFESGVQRILRWSSTSSGNPNLVRNKGWGSGDEACEHMKIQEVNWNVKTTKKSQNEDIKAILLILRKETFWEEMPLNLQNLTL